jgi:hypothetical protein
MGRWRGGRKLVLAAAIAALAAGTAAFAYGATLPVTLQ